MPPCCDVCGVSEHTVRSPGHEVGDACSDLQFAPRAEIALDGLER
jgi:hypothetical protein